MAQCIISKWNLLTPLEVPAVKPVHLMFKMHVRSNKSCTILTLATSSVCTVWEFIFSSSAAVIIVITRNDSSPTAGSIFTLTCSAVEFVDHSGETVMVWKDPEGQNITSSSSDFIISRQNMNQRVDYSLQFNPVKVLHTGVYTCEVSIPNVGYHDSRNFNLQVTPGSYFIDAHKQITEINVSLFIGILEVIIQTNGTSQVGTPHLLTCHIGTIPTPPIGAVTYEWTSTCSGDCFILKQSTAAAVSTQYLKAADSGTHTCTVTDSVGNRGSASVEISTSGRLKIYS